MTEALMITTQKGMNITDINKELIDIPDYIKRISFVNQYKYCGYYNFGNTIIINVNCKEYSIKEILRHELNHAYWFTIMTWQERKTHCNPNDRRCWEHYANSAL